MSKLLGLENDLCYIRCRWCDAWYVVRSNPLRATASYEPSPRAKTHMTPKSPKGERISERNESLETFCSREVETLRAVQRGYLPVRLSEGVCLNSTCDVIPLTNTPKGVLVLCKLAV